MSPFFRSLPIEIPWIEPSAPCAHPLDDGIVVLLEHSIKDTVANLDAFDGRKYRSLLEPLARDFADLAADLLGPIQHISHHPLLLARFGFPALLPGASLARSRFSGVRARALFAGMAAHSALSLEAPASAAVGLVLMAAGHASGWPIVRGGAQTLTDALASHLELLDGRIETGREVKKLPEADLILADVTPRQLLRIAGPVLPPSYLRQLERFRYGAGTFKIDYALNSPIPWTANECSRAATVHLGGTLRKSSRQSGTSPPTLPSFWSSSLHSSTPPALPQATTQHGPIAMSLMAVLPIASRLSSVRSNVSPPVSVIALSPVPSPLLRHSSAGIRT